MFQLFFLKSSKVYEVLFISLSFKRSIFLEIKKKKKKKKKSIWIVEFFQYAITIFFRFSSSSSFFSFFFFFFYRIFKNMRTDLNFRSIRINKNASFATWTTGILIFDKKYEANVVQMWLRHIWNRHFRFSTHSKSGRHSDIRKLLGEWIKQRNNSDHEIRIIRDFTIIQNYFANILYFRISLLSRTTPIHQTKFCSVYLESIL